MTPLEEGIIQKLNQQKGESMGLQAMVVAILRSLPAEQRAQVLQEFDTEIRHARDVLAYSAVPDEVIQGLDGYVSTMNQIRVLPNLE